MGKKILILGSGYTGKFLSQKLRERGDEVLETKTTATNQAFTKIFDFNDLKTWDFESKFDECYWLAPSPSKDLIESFMTQAARQIGKINLVSSTGFFIHQHADQKVHRASPLSLTIPRVQAEEFLRAKYEAQIIHVAGIYGPGRNPKDWLRSGRIQVSNKFLNLIYVTDLVDFLIRSMSQHIPNSRWLLSDQHPVRWKDLYEAWKLELPKMPTSSAHSQDSKRIDPTESFEQFQWQPQIKNIFEGIALLEKG